jgi:hypothetical protein
LNPGNSVYNLHRAVRLKGALRLPALVRTMQRITLRHEVLRTTFDSIDGRPIQVISKDAKLGLSVIDLDRYPKEEHERLAIEISRREARRPFDLENGPLLRICLLRYSAEEHVLLFTMHHIISDGWSLGILVREVVKLYEAFVNHRSDPLPELTIHYADYAEWQRSLLHGSGLESRLKYWKDHLAGAPDELALPRDYARPTTQSYRGGRHYLRLTRPTTKAIWTLSRAENVTPFMTLLAAFYILLHYYAESDDIIIGTDVANRQRAETENLIGMFVNQLVLRIKLSGNPTFQEVVGRVRSVCLEAYVHQDVPFDRLVEALNPVRDLSRNPLFHVMFGLQNEPLPALSLVDLTLESLKIEKEQAVFELALYMMESDEGWSGVWTYHTDLFKTSTIVRMSEHYERLLGEILADPTIRLSRLVTVLAAADGERRNTQREKFIDARRRMLGAAKLKNSAS